MTPSCARCRLDGRSDCVCGAQSGKFMMFGTLALAVCLVHGRGVRACLALAALASYFAWASYWGSQAVRRFVVKSSETHPFGFGFAVDWVQGRFHLYGLVFGPLLLGALYGALGGWYPEFRRTRRLAKDPQAALDQGVDGS